MLWAWADDSSNSRSNVDGADIVALYLGKPYFTADSVIASYNVLQWMKYC
jgi:hypothetical protein